jgi:hypothetical protein
VTDTTAVIAGEMRKANKKRVIFPELITAWADRLTALGWRPIETAPKDGTDVLLFEAGFVPGQYVTNWRKFTDGFGDQYEGWASPDSGELGPCRMAPTHWMPLPPAPQGEPR